MIRHFAVLLVALLILACGGSNPALVPPGSPPDPLADWQRIADDADDYLGYVELALSVIEPGSISLNLRQAVEKGLAVARPALKTYQAALDLARDIGGGADRLEETARDLHESIQELKQAFVALKAQERRVLEVRGR